MVFYTISAYSKDFGTQGSSVEVRNTSLTAAIEEMVALVSWCHKRYSTFTVSLVDWDVEDREHPYKTQKSWHHSWEQLQSIHG